MAGYSSNQEIIDDLTKDLDAATLQDDDSDSKAFGSADTSLEEDTDHKSMEKNSTNKVDENEFIDECSLQDRDALLSDEEKKNFLTKVLNYKIEGNSLYKSGQFQESIIIYSNALKICPLNFTNDRSILYANRAASKQKLERKESAIEDCTKAIELNSSYVKAYLRRAVLYEETEKLDEALNDYKQVIEIDSRNEDAISATMRLPQQIDERNEKMKAEMMDKLKDLGNMFLKPFGLSTNNFQMTKDPNSGGYSVNFVQNK